jgi:DNA replication protein DnaD
MKEIIEKNKWLFKQFTMMNRTATSVYGAIQGGIDLNFYKCYTEYENGVFGWVKESRAFNTAVEIYEQYTANDGWDIINQLEVEFGDELLNIEYDEISKWENELANYDGVF